MKTGVRKRPALALDPVIAYRNPRVRDRYLREFGGSTDEADRVFVEMLKWLYLSERGMRRRTRVTCVMTPDIAKLDDMWHTFLLFTRDYTAFCNRRFGAYKHHDPNPGEWTGPLSQPRLVRAKRERRAFYALVYDTFGEETFRDWFLRGTFRRSKRSSARTSPRRRLDRERG